MLLLWSAQRAFVALSSPVLPCVDKRAWWPRSGDVLLFRGNFCIEFISKSAWSHVAVVLRRPIDGTLLCVDITGKSRFPRVRMLSRVLARNTRLQHLDRHGDWRHCSNALAVLRINREANALLMETCVRHALDMRVQYAHTYWQEMADRYFGFLSLPYHTANTSFCSAFVSDILASCGVLPHDACPLLPEDFATSNFVCRRPYSYSSATLLQ